MAGLCGGAVAAWLLGTTTGGAEGDPIDVEARVLRADRTSAATAKAVSALADRLDEVERRVALSDGGDRRGADELAPLLAALQSMRDDVRRELELVAARLDWLEARVADTPGTVDDGSLSEDQEKELAILAHDADDAGVRFSALVLLGRRRTDRSVQASRDRLSDERDYVVWQALRNLGRFAEVDAAVAVAERLDHESAVVRAAAVLALRAMGAPDFGYDPSAPPADRVGPAQDLRTWAEEQQAE